MADVNPRLWKVAFKGTFPFFEAKLKNGAITSVAAWTGTKDRTTHATGSGATVTQISEVLGALIDDLQTRGLIK